MSIGEDAFYESSLTLTSVTLPANMQLSKNSRLPGGCLDEYERNYQKAGTITRPNTNSNTWTYRAR
jgi:hypothetical protein